MEVTALKGSSGDVQHFADGRFWSGEAVLNQTPVDLGIPFVHETEHPAFYKYRGSYPRRNGSPQNCSSRAGDERSAVPVSAFRTASFPRIRLAGRHGTF